MKSEILDKNKLTNIQMGMVWTFPEPKEPEDPRFPDWSQTENIPEYWRKPTYIYLESGFKSGATDFLKYATVHDTRDSWNPADLYGPGTIDALGLDPEAYQNLEGVILPEFIDPEDVFDPDRVIDEPWETNIRFFGTVTLLENRISLLRLPKDTWKIEFYSFSGVSKNYGNSLILSEFKTNLEVYPVLRVTYGPDIMLKNNPDNYYYTVPQGRTESVTGLEYKRQIDELRSEKILAVKFTSTGLEHLETFNLSTGSWYTQRESGQVPERHKSLYYLGKAELRDTHDIKVHETTGNILIDPLSGIILGTSKLKESPVRDMIRKNAQPEYKDTQLYNPHVRYSRLDVVDYQGKEYVSEVSGNIDALPVYSGLWSMKNPVFPELQPDYRKVTLYTDGPGDIQFPDSEISIIGSCNKGCVGTTDDFIRIKIVPESGHVLDSPNPYSFDLDERVSNLVSEGDNIYTLRLGNLYGGESFCFRFIPIEVNIVTDFIVPEYNYYTYLGDGRYRDYGVSYNSLSGMDNNTVHSLPRCTGMLVSYTLESGEPISGAKFESIEGITVSIPSTTDLVKSDTKIKIMYHGLLNYYDLTDWDTGAKAIYHNNTSEYGVSLGRSSCDIGQDGSSLWVSFKLLEAITHLEINLVPKKIPIRISTSDAWDSSTDGAYVHVGQSILFDIYSHIPNQEPVIDIGDLDAVISKERTSSRLWKVLISEVRTSGTVNIS